MTAEINQSEYSKSKAKVAEVLVELVRPSMERQMKKKKYTYGPNGEIVAPGQSAVFTETYPEGHTFMTRKTWNGKEWVISDDQDLYLTASEIK